MVRSTAAQTDSPEEGRASTEDTSTPSPRVASRGHAVTRANPRNENTEGSALVCELPERDSPRRTSLHLSTVRKQRTATGHEKLVIAEIEPGRDYQFDPGGRLGRTILLGGK